MGQSNYHERSEDIDRPGERTAEQDEHDPLSFLSMLRAADAQRNLQALIRQGIAENICRPDEPTVEQDEHDPFSFASMCRVARQSGRLQALRAMLLAASVEKAEAAREEAEDV